MTFDASETPPSVPAKKKGARENLGCDCLQRRGTGACFRSEEAFRIESILSVFLIPLAVILGETALETALLLFAIMLVLLVELLNSAVETVVDRVSLDYHELSKKAKDIASGAVFVSLMTFLLIWSVLLFDRLPI